MYLGEGTTRDPNSPLKSAKVHLTCGYALRTLYGHSNRFIQFSESLGLAALRKRMRFIATQKSFLTSNGGHI
jgi:hypothetical protein